MERISTEGKMQPIVMQKGLDNTFYFAECDHDEAPTRVLQLKFKLSYDDFEKEQQLVYELNAGKILALEIDPDIFLKAQDAIRNIKFNESKSQMNELFILDDQFQLVQLKEKEDGEYNTIEKQNLKEIPEI